MSVTDIKNLTKEMQSSEYFRLIDEFEKEYPSKKTIGAGAYGSVYLVEERDVVVKVGNLEGLLKDIDILSQVVHPNIIPVLSASIDIKNMRGLIAMPRGVPIAEYAKGLGKLSQSLGFKRIFYELLCGLDAMECIGIVHGDIKPANIVVVDGHPVYIDFGISEWTHRICPNTCKSMYFAKTLKYTPGYRDPEFLPDMLNSNEGDIFALAKTVESLLHGGFYASNLPMYTSSSGINRLLKKMLSPRAERPTAGELMTDPYFDDVRAQCNCVERTIPQIGFKDPSSLEEQYYDAVYELLVIALEHNIRMRSLFLILHNVHRSIGAMNGKKASSMYLLVMANMAIVMSIHENWMLLDSIYLTEGFSMYDLSSMISDVMRELEGIVVTRTYWDIAVSGESLIPMLENTIWWDYTGPKELKQVSSTMTKYQGTTMLILWMRPIKDGPSLRNRIENNPTEQGEIIPSKYLRRSDRDVAPRIDLEALARRMKRQDYTFDILNDLSKVYALREIMSKDQFLANKVLREIVKDRNYNRMYDIVFGPEKVKLTPLHVIMLNVNAYTTPYEELLK